MGKTTKEFVANELWKVVAILTLGTIIVLGSLELEMASGVAVGVGWFMLAPLLYFWGAEIAEYLYGEESSANRRQTTQDAAALTDLKQRYARGEIDEGEFERRLDRLVALEAVPEEAQALIETNAHGSANSDSSGEHDRDTERDQELDS